MTTNTTRVALAESAVERIEKQIATLTAAKDSAARAAAEDPTDANVKRLRSARHELDDAREILTIARANLETARKEAASAETAEHAEKARAAAQKASRRAFRAAIGPHVEVLVRARDEAERAIAAISSVVDEQRRAASEAIQHAALAGISIEVPRLEMADATAHVLAAMSRGQHLPVGSWFATIAEELHLAREVFTRLGIGEPLSLADRMSYREMVERALEGEDVYATVRPVSAAAE